MLKTKQKYFFSNIYQIVYLPGGLFIFLILLFSCSSTNNQTDYKWNLASIYNPFQTRIHPTYKVFHNSSNTSVLFIKVRTNELLFRPNATGNDETCSFKIAYKLQKVEEDLNAIVDSNSYVYDLKKSDVQDYYTTQIPIKAELGGSYRLKVTIRDNHQKSFNISYLNVEKNNNIGEQFFNLTSLNGTPLFKNVIINNGMFKIDHTFHTSNKLYISYYKEKLNTPQPDRPAQSDSMRYSKYDSLYIIDYTPNTPISLTNNGLYFFQFDTLSNEGLSVLKLDQDFPKIQDPKGLIPPLTYITTSAEYKNLINGENAKLLADNFWIKNGGNVDRGRELIRLFYNRVYFSNYYFTNNKPGWETERGMVYIVYGPPHQIDKSAEQEIWIYNRKGQSLPIKFTFKYRPNKYSINKFQLSRKNSQEWGWTEAIYAWSSGDIFLFD